MATRLEQRIRHERKRKGVLVPLLEDLFTKPVEIEHEDDLDFIYTTLQLQLVRAEQRDSQPLFSPSQLAECLRYVYLLKHHKDLGISKLASVRIEPHYYFFNGNWLHLKWQFALYKLDKSINDPKIFKLIAVELPIVSKRKDHGGTVDALVLIHGELYIVDFKGLNVRTFGEITRGWIPSQYVVQLADYGMLFNSQRLNGSAGKVTKALLVAENKGGATYDHPLALTEQEITIRTHLPEVRSRLELLREHANEETLPEPACVSTGTTQFQGCPFRKFCRQEIKAIERRNRRAEREDAANLGVAVPRKSRNRRTRRDRER